MPADILGKISSGKERLHFLKVLEMLREGDTVRKHQKV